MMNYVIDIIMIDYKYLLFQIRLDVLYNYWSLKNLIF